MASDEKVNILIVDDRPENLLALEAVLSSPRYNLTKAQSGVEALKQLMDKDFALVLLDVQMPELDGFETARLIKARKKTKNIPLIFITAISQATEHVVQGHSVGAIDYICKPFNPETLRLKVEGLANLYQSQQGIKLQNELLTQLEEERKQQNNFLEEMVRERTVQLSYTNEKLALEIKERQQAESDLRHSEELFRKIFAASPSLIAIRSLKQKKYIDVNQSWVNYTGYSYEAVVNDFFAELSFAFISAQREEFVLDLESEEVVHNVKVKYKTRSGETRQGLLSKEIIEIQGEKCSLIVITDITERMLLEKEISQLDRLNLIGVMAAGIAHEVRNPMTTVRGFLQVAKGNPSVLTPGHIDLMMEELDRANGIISEFLALAKHKQTNQKLEQLNNIAEALFPLIKVEASRTGKFIVLDLGECPPVFLDGKEIRQLILNLALNGLDAMAAGGRLSIKTYVENQFVVLEVADQGSGIKEELLGKIWVPFFTTKEKGTGLGLAICYSIAARHQAKIAVNTSNQGTTFIIRFKLEG